jgi:hypothetical protein
MAAHPKLAAFAIGLAISMAIGTAIGMLEVQQAHAVFESLIGRRCNGC